MGQAQLLLIVLGVVLVGIAIIAGIQAYTTNNVKASIDAQVHDMMRIGSDAQLWVQKPLQFGGPVTYANLAEVLDFGTLSYTNTNGTPATGTWTNVNAVYTHTAGDPMVVTSTNVDLGTFVSLEVCGITDSQIVVGTSTLSTADAQGKEIACVP